VWVYVDELCAVCPECSSDDPEILDEATLIEQSKRIRGDGGRRL
jgi:hypothetical protein